MFMDIPIPTEEIGPDWAIELVTAFGQIDSHNHTTGEGRPVPTGGISIDQPLAFNSVNVLGVSATGLRSTQYVNLAAPITPAIPDHDSLFFSGGNLFVQDGTGVNIQITLAGNINASGAGSITGMAPPAAVTYNSVTKTFTFISNTGVPATIAAGPYQLSPLASNTFNIAITAPTLASSYTLTLPAAPPVVGAGVVSLLSEDNTGTVSYTNTDNTTLQNVANVLSIKSVPRTLITGTINTVVSPSSGSYSHPGDGLFHTVITTPTITTGGSAVMIMLVPDGSTTATLSAGLFAGGSSPAFLQILRDATVLSVATIFSVDSIEVPPGVISFVDTGVTAGGHTYALQARADAAFVLQVQHSVLRVYEMQ